MSHYRHPGKKSLGKTTSASAGKQEIRLLAENGQLQKARKLAIRACNNNKGDAESWFILGTIHGHLEDYRKAAECCRRAIAIRPDVPMAYYNLGIALHRLGNYEDAIESFKRACAIQPDFAEAFHDQGYSHLAAGNSQEAVKCYQKALELKPAFTLAHLGLAHAYLSIGQHPAAISCLERALALNPGLVDAHFHLGNLLAESNHIEAAIGHFQQAIRLNPELLEVRVNLGNLLQSNDRAAEAIVVLSEAVHKHTGSSVAHYNLGNAYRAEGNYPLAEMSYRRALDIEPDMAVAYINLGLALQDQDKWPEAIDHFRKAVTLNPDMTAAHSNLAHTYRELGEYRNALEILDKAIERLPDEPELHWDRSLLWLLTGNFRSGWPEYEWRWKGRGLKPRAFPQTRWKGSDLSGKTVLVWSEQGIGDELMFASCYPDLIAQAGHIIIDCEPRLEALFRRSFQNATVHGGPKNDDTGWLAGLPAVDYQIPAGSLPLHFRPALDSFPMHSGYLCPDQEEIRAWRGRYNSLGPGMKIGISWRGGHISKTKKRSTTLDQWQAVLSHHGVHFINLQYGPCTEELQSIEDETGIVIHHWPESDPLKNLDGFAAQISALDLVISVDNSTVHMAGAVGTTVWLLQPYSPDWRWQTEVDSSYWYPSLRQFRQPGFDDWPPVFEQITTALVGRHT